MNIDPDTRFGVVSGSPGRSLESSSTSKPALYGTAVTIMLSFQLARKRGDKDPRLDLHIWVLYYLS